MKNKSIGICDPNQLFREGLKSLMGHSQFTVAFAVGNWDELIVALDPDHEPALIIYGLESDYDLPTELVELRDAAKSAPKLVLLANAPAASLLRAAAEAGVQAVLSRNISGEVLQRALEFVLLGQRLFPAPHFEDYDGGRVGIEPPVTALRPVQPFERTRNADQSVQLSEREAQIVGCLVEGASNKQIARDLGITEATVKVHIKGLLRKLRVSNRTQAAVWGLNNPYAIDNRANPVLELVSTLPPLSLVS